MRDKRALRVGYAVAFSLFSAAGFAADPLAFFGFDEAQYSEAAREGLREINSGRMFNVTIPVGMVRARLAGDAKVRGELGYDPASPEGWFYREGALPAPPGYSDPTLPLGYSTVERNGAKLASINCFLCHAGVVNGTVVAGLGSNSVIQPSGNAPSRGDNYGQYAVWMYAARVADPANTGLRTTGEKTELVKLVESTQLPPVQSMPWWLMKYKVKDYWYGDGGPSDAAHFSLNFTVAHAKVNENHAAHVASTAKALAFARETQSPIFPGALDAALVELGADLFHGRKEPAEKGGFRACHECHGDYTRKASATDFSKPGSWAVDYDGSEALRDVGTDSSYNEVINKFQPIIDHLAKLKDYYDAQGTPELCPTDQPLKGKGYIPPPLVGVWATAPYFHNGSVPTIEAVLNSKERPEIWARDQGPHAYDLAKVGMKHTALTREEYATGREAARAAHPMSKIAVDQTYIYDTRAFGRGAMGHTFGDSLSPWERAAVIEFLKSLSGTDM